MKTADMFKLVSIPTILVCGETHDLCSCDEVGTKEVVYYQFVAGKLRKFREIICEKCLNSGDFAEGKTGLSIMPYKSDRQIQEDYDFDNRMFTEIKTYTKKSKL